MVGLGISNQLPHIELHCMMDGHGVDKLVVVDEHTTNRGGFEVRIEWQIGAGRPKPEIDTIFVQLSDDQARQLAGWLLGRVHKFDRST